MHFQHILHIGVLILLNFRKIFIIMLLNCWRKEHDVVLGLPSIHLLTHRERISLQSLSCLRSNL